MAARSVALVVLIVVTAGLAVAVDRTFFGAASPTATPARSGPLGVGTSAPPSPTVVAPSATIAATPPPTRTPTTSCPPLPAGGRAGRFHPLVDVRVAHQPGADRLVFDFGPEAVGEQDDVPVYRIEPATTFTAVSGQTVVIEGSAFWRVRFDNASTADMSGQLVYRGPREIRPGLPLIREVELVEDFEHVMIWGVGLARLECPQVSTLRSPLRLVIDLPSAP